MDGEQRAGSTGDSPSRRADDELNALRGEVESLRRDLARSERVIERLEVERDAIERERDAQSSEAAKHYGWRARLESSRRFRVFRGLGLVPVEGSLVGHWMRRTLALAYAAFVRVCPEGSRRKQLARRVAALVLRRAAADREEAPVVVSLVVSWPASRSVMPGLLECVQSQTHARTELIVLVEGDVEECRPLQAEERVRVLTWRGDLDEDVHRHVAFVSGAWWLEIDDAAAAPASLVADLLGRAGEDPAADRIEGSGGRLIANKRWVGTPRRGAAPLSVSVHPDLTESGDGAAWSERSEADVILQPCRASVDVEGSRATALFVGSDPDEPYRMRHEFTAARRVAVTTDERTAARLRFLAPRTLVADSVESLLPRLASSSFSGVCEVGDDPRLEPLTLERPCRIAIQVDDFLEGGMETVMMDLAESLAPLGLSCCLLILGETGHATEVARERGLEIHQVRPSAAEYRAFLAENDIDLVNAHYSTFGADICQRLGVPFVQNVHNMYMWFGPELATRFRAADRFTQAYICVSKNAARYSDVKLELAPHKMVVIPNGCDPAYMDSVENRQSGAAIRAELGLSPDDRVFLNVASIQAIKGQRLLVDALGSIQRECPNAHVVIIGRPVNAEYAATVDRAVEELGLEGRVHLVGHRKDVPAFYAAADALVMPSVFEGWSLAITEAVLAGLPVIATDVGGASDQLRGTTGIVVEPVFKNLREVDGFRLAEALKSRQFRVRDDIAAAMRAVYARGGERSPLPDRWETLTRQVAYSRYAHVFRWLIAGGHAAACAYWTEPTLDLGFLDAEGGGEVVVPAP